eukprot:CAMPEP_0119280778 /NCGR_PEP_ID=MMETSP1329-20130426/23419_1 /TAXON_ID=114041 /ORGANISM="Genus nov. species nov., Strain RCC1024" /LENGTH=294 /DNA_ID=CAMNT_0007281377 /DNA_START=126 /DNA_END=1006 /DNA_ORIENTATION=+
MPRGRAFALIAAASAHRPAATRRATLGAPALVAATTFARPASADAAPPRYIEEKAAAVLAPDGSVKGYETVRRLTGEQTGLDLSRRVELNIFDDATVKEWPASPPWSANDFKRLDESDDAAFYPKEQPRLVYHIDEGAVAALTNFYKGEIKDKADVLDICSSWVSHYPVDKPLGRVAGTGMNERELKANTQLTEYAQRDLNKEPTLPFKDNSFDVVTCVVSIDYLTKPVEILKEVSRVLRPGGKVILSQSNRMFMTKAVRMWISMGDEAHLELIGQYLQYAGGFARPKAFDITA